MSGKKGQFFGLYLVFITLIMCGVVVGLFYTQQKDINSSLVSPSSVLKLEDNLELFEIREMEIINESFLEANKSGNFGSYAFSYKFKDFFIEGVLKDDKMMEFIFSDLYFEDRAIDISSGKEFLKNVLYDNMLSDCKNDERTFRRNVVDKKFVLKGSERNKINFPVDFSFSFGKEYKINSDGGVF